MYLIWYDYWCFVSGYIYLRYFCFWYISGSYSDVVWSLGLHLLPANFPVGLCSVSVLPGCQSPKSPRCASKPKTKKIMYDTAENDDFDREEIATYEEVAKLYPRPGLHRPVVLIGPPGVGRNELKRRLIATDQEKYKTPIPCEYHCVVLFSFIIGNIYFGV